MKASELIKTGNELQHKVRTVSDLIRHIKTRETDSETANYNLFFGAGCSVSSKIRTARELTDEWIRDLYERFNSISPSSIEEAIEYFENKQSSWYNKANSYSSLFEKTYEFAAQRRRFVEREVDKKLPAIGYAYLTSLVGTKYFNTVFTTNFDDLINEAFYQFSNERPLMCAHDSSIKSISITSKRPKIIKLHGDYLFDDIKSTLRETESLEHNTKEKLIEYCKDFGLIVIGYSGNDRSVMEILDFLTKQDNYLKNGIYWCLRENDIINSTLQNLFWREKVYPVIIDGFDELFAEIHTKLLGTGLDFEASMKNSKLQQIKKFILDENNPLNSNQYIRNDIKNIKETNNKQEISDFISSLQSDGESDGLSLTGLRNLLEIEDLLKKKEFDKAYQLAEEFYYQATEVKDKSRYISMLVSISDKKNNSGECIRWCDKLIDLDQNNISYIIKKSHYLGDLSTKYSFLNTNSDKYNYKFELLNASVIAGYTLMINDPLNNEVNAVILINQLNASLTLNPSLSNFSWIKKIDLLYRIKKEYNKNTEKEKVEAIQVEIDAHIEAACKINSKSLVTLRLKLHKFSIEENFDGTNKLITSLYKLHDEMDISNKVYVNEILNKAIGGFREYNKLVDSKSLESYFYEKHLNDKDIQNNSELLLSKSKYFISNGNQSIKAKSYFLSALEDSDVILNFKTAILVNYCLEYVYTERLLEILEENKKKILERYYFEYKHLLSLDKKDYSHSLEYLEKSYAAGLSLTTYCLNFSYFCVLTNKFNDLINFEKNNREKIASINCESFKINFLYAAKKLNHKKYDAIYLRNITAKSLEPDLKLAAFAVLEQESDVKRLLNEQINRSYINYYIFNKWPIIMKKLLLNHAATEAA